MKQENYWKHEHCEVNGNKTKVGKRGMSEGYTGKKKCEKENYKKKYMQADGKKIVFREI